MQDPFYRAVCPSLPSQNSFKWHVQGFCQHWTEKNHGLPDIFQNLEISGIIPLHYHWSYPSFVDEQTRWNQVTHTPFEAWTAYPPVPQSPTQAAAESGSFKFSATVSKASKRTCRAKLWRMPRSLVSWGNDHADHGPQRFIGGKPSSCSYSSCPNGKPWAFHIYVGLRQGSPGYIPTCLLKGCTTFLISRVYHELPWGLMVKV